MTANPAKSGHGTTRQSARVVIVVYPGVTLLDVTGPAQVFGTAREIAGQRAPYEIILAANSSSPTVTDTGLSLGTVSLKRAAARPIDTLLVAGGLGVFQACNDARLANWIGREARKARRSGSTCMGAFLTASAGILNGRRVATHWRWCAELRRRHPEVEVEGDPVFVKDGSLWSSAGVTAGIDMALAMVEEDHDRDLALKVAQSLVVFLKRPGGQSQFSAALTAQVADMDATFEALHRWVSDNTEADLRVDRLAERMGMSPRTFARLYTARMGVTPAKAIERIRLEAARRLLEQQETPFADVADRSGFGDKDRMRRAFTRCLRITPSEYRRRFATA
jgi:transcriptional regulator GlxA family with amidase domain